MSYCRVTMPGVAAGVALISGTVCEGCQLLWHRQADVPSSLCSVKRQHVTVHSSRAIPMTLSGQVSHASPPSCAT